MSIWICKNRGLNCRWQYDIILYIILAAELLGRIGGISMFVISKDNCADCGYCNYICPFGSLIHHVDEKYWEIDQEKCKQCGICFSSCIASAIECDEDQQVVESIVITDKCIGCSLCSRKCPAGAISGEIKKQFTIDPAKCMKCGFCATVCRQNAIDVVKKNAIAPKGKKKVKK